MLNRIILFFSLFVSVGVLAQDAGQEVWGTVRDKESKHSVPGATIALYQDTILINKTICEVSGLFWFEGVPVGRYEIVVGSLSYHSVRQEVVVDAGKHSLVEFELVPSIKEMNRVVISLDSIVSQDHVNEDGGREFVAQETGRYPGSRQDPARMATNFAGVQGGDDSRNDLVIRGNSPMGVLWRVEGLNIPNPNHFSISGSTGGPISVLNNKTLGTSEFFAGAFPSKYGNALAGVFDLEFKTGNSREHEFSGQLGILGVEAIAEGPINKEKKSSYLAAYRYSTLDIFKGLGVDFGTDAVPKYQDATFKIDLPSEKIHATIFGVAGVSDITINVSETENFNDLDLYAQNDRDQDYGSGMAMLGFSLSGYLQDSTRLKSTFGGSVDNQNGEHRFVERQLLSDNTFQVDSIFPFINFSLNQYKLMNHTQIKHIAGKSDVLEGGIITELNRYDMQDSIMNLDTEIWRNRWDYTGNALFMEGYFNWKHRFAQDWVLLTGWHLQYFGLNNATSLIEPRLRVTKWLGKTTSATMAVGMHSQMQPQYQYFYNGINSQGQDERYNEDMGFSRSVHWVGGYETQLKKGYRLKLEGYYQYLYQLAVEDESSAFSMINRGSGFNRFYPSELVNEGTGRNFGLEATLVHPFAKNYFVMFTGALYDSKYKGSDGILRNSDYNGRYAGNVLLGYEIKTGEKSMLELGLKITVAGGKRYGVIDTVASEETQTIMYRDSLYNEFEFRDYFRTDFKVSYKIQGKKVTHEIAFDLLNVFDTQNLLGLTYAPVPGTSLPFARESYQLGRLPIFYYKVDF